MSTDTIKRTVRDDSNRVIIDHEQLRLLDFCAGEKCHIFIDSSDSFFLLPVSLNIDIDTLKEHGIHYLDTRYINNTKNSIYVGSKVMNEIKKLQNRKDEEPRLDVYANYSDEIQTSLIYFDILN